MSFTDNFGNPKGLLGRMMLVSMDKEHLPMAEWGFAQFEMPKKADILDMDAAGFADVEIFKKDNMFCVIGKKKG